MKKKWLTLKLVILILFIYSITVCWRSVYLHDKVFKQNLTVIKDSYYIGLSTPESYELDSLGVVMVNLNSLKQRALSGGTVYHPTTIALMGLYYFNEYKKTGDSHFLDSSMMQGSYYVRNQKTNGGWEFDFEVGGDYKIKPKFVDAMAQGLAISLMGRLFMESGDSLFYLTSKRALNVFLTKVSDGGVLTIGEDSLWFFEEAPTSPPHHILNGFMFSIIGLKDYQIYFGSDSLSDMLFNKSIFTLKSVLKKYDAGFWSKYSLNPKSNLWNHYSLASPNYHNLHSDQLKIISRLTCDNQFNDYAIRFSSYNNTIFSYSWCAIYVAFRDLMELRGLYHKLFN